MEISVKDYSEQVTNDTKEFKNEDVCKSDNKLEIVYILAAAFLYFHIAAAYGVYIAITSAKWQTLIHALVFHFLTCLGITAGLHRLWSHKSYKAKLPLEILLMIFASMSGQYTIKNWVRDHRMHHKYSDTDADPHNARRGFFYSHIGWLIVKRHKEFKRLGHTIDLTDIINNPVVSFQKKYKSIIIPLLCFVIPTLIPMYLWNETLNVAWHITILRFVLTLHITFTVNSIAHKWGYKPFDKRIRPSQTIPVAILTMGEGYHNYHHTFPWDYRTSEFGNKWLNFTTVFIHFFAWIGWAYDMKSVSEEVIDNRKKRTGDGTNL